MAPRDQPTTSGNLTLRLSACLAFSLLGIAGRAPAQRFGFTHEMFPATGGGSQAVALGDVDGDGDLDAFLGAWLGLWRNEGTGIFTDATAANLPGLGLFADAVALGDVDGDGDLDAFVAFEGSGIAPGLIRLVLNNGTGIFMDVTATSLPTILGGANAIALGDVDGDGDLDAFVGRQFWADWLLLNAGAGTFTDATATNLPGLSYSRAVALDDLDGDGDVDALLCSGAQNRCYRNSGSGIFTDVTAATLPALTEISVAVALGDVDADGDLDAFLGNQPAPDRLLLNAGAGTFTDATPTNLSGLLGASQDVDLGDVDGDGDLDVFLRVAGGQNRLYLNGGAGVFSDATGTNLPALADPAQAIALGDMDGDGDLDAFVGVSNGLSQNRLYLNDGTGRFSDSTAPNLPSLLEETQGVALGDIDGDGDLDAFLGTDGQARLILNSGAGIFSDATATNLPAFAGNVLAVALGDVDGDGDLDAFLGTQGQARLYLNAGPGLFADATATSLPALTASTLATALGDVDGDGDLDALLGNGGVGASSGVRLYVNGGSGVFADATVTNLPPSVASTSAVALGDVDGDGDLDALIGNLYQPNRLYLNGGTGVFLDATATSLPASPVLTSAVALGDVDGDGDLDAFLGTYGQVLLYLNNGAGVFVDVSPTNLPAIFETTMVVALGDVDGDGDLDAFVGGGDPAAPQNRLFLNGGAGVFTDATASDLPAAWAYSVAVALGDLDGDDDLDAIAGTSGQDRLYTNLTRQLAWRGIPRVGKPLTLDLRGPGNGTWLLAASAGSANIPLPPFGPLRLLPSTLFIVAGGPLDPGGQADLTFPVPANPTLVGTSLYWQAVVGPPLRFTNLEITVLTNL